MAAMVPNLTLLRRQFSSSDMSTRREGVAAALSDPKTVAEVLSDIGFVPSSDEIGLGRITAGPLFTGKNPSEQSRLDLSLWALLSALPPTHETAQPLRDSVTSLSVSAGATASELDVSDLRVFTKLQQLRVHNARPLLGLKTLAELRFLREITLDRCGLGDGLSPLAASSSIQRITFDGALSSLGDLGDFPSLKTLDIKHRGALLNLDGLQRLASLEELSLDTVTGSPDLRDFRGLRSLQRLSLPQIGSLGSLAGIEGCTRLEKLNLGNGWSITSITELAALRDLRELSLSGLYNVTDISALAHLRKLRHLNLSTVRMASLDALRGISLESLDISRCQLLLSLDGIEDSNNIRTLNLQGCLALRSLQALRGFTQLTLLSLPNAQALESLDGLQGAQSLSSLVVRSAPRLSSLEALKGLTSLKSLVLEGSGGIRDITPLATLHALEKLDLRHCPRVTDPSPLTTLRTLRAVALKGTGINPRSLPEALAKVTSWARNPDLDAKLEPRAPHARKNPLPKGTGSAVRKKISSLRKLLSARDLSQIDQGREILVSLGDDSLWEQFLNGVTWKIDPKEGHGELVPNSFFETSKRAKIFRDHCLFSLIASAPEGSATATILREAITSLSLEGHTSFVPVSVDLSVYAKLPKLSALDMYYCTEVIHPEALAAMTSLRALTLRNCSPGLQSQLQGLGLRSLTIERFEAARLTQLSTLSALEELTLSNCTDSAGLSLKNCTSLHTLHLRSIPKLESIDLWGCTSLDRVRLQPGTSTATVEILGVESLSALKSVTLYAPTSRVVSKLLSPSSLRAIEIYNCVALEDLEALTNLTELRSLKLQHIPSLKNIDALARCNKLETLHLEACPSLGAMTPLAALTKLKSLSLRRSPFKDDMNFLNALTKLKHLDLTATQRAPSELTERLRAIARWK